MARHPIPESEYRPLRIRMTSVDDGIARVRRFDPVTGEPTLVHAVTGAPLPRAAGPVHFSDLDGNEVDTPHHIRVNHGTEARYEWITLENQRAVHRPGGPPEAPWSTTQTFVQADFIVLHLKEGDVRYKVVRQPDKYDSAGIPTDRVGDRDSRIFWDYLADRV